VQRLPYFAEQAAEALAPFDTLVLIGAAAPVSFFAYPDKESWLTPERLRAAHAGRGRRGRRRGDRRGAGRPRRRRRAGTAYATPAPRGGGRALNPLTVGQIISNEMPENAIVSDEGATCGLAAYLCTEQAPAHDWLTLTGGAIGQGLPLALGAALACPERKVIALQADGSAMYTIQALWSMARENADVTVVLLNNKSYAILNIELERVGAGNRTPRPCPCSTCPIRT
jgi:acetolactate synthase-1/2/3 large subunit